MNFPNILGKSKELYFLISISLLFILLRIPSLFEPHWYGDEGIYETIGLALQNNRILYKEIWDNKPPLLYMLYALASADQFLIRLFSLIVGTCSVIVFYFLARSLIAKSAAITAFLFAVLFGMPLLEGNIANSENFMMLPVLVAAILIVRLHQKKFYNFLAGLFLSCAFLLKSVAVFDFAAFSLFILFVSYKNNIKLSQVINTIVPFWVGFFSLLFLTCLYFISNNAILDFFQASFQQNVGYVGYGNSFLIPQGFLILKGLLLISFIGLLWVKRKEIPLVILFILLWLSFSLFNAFFSGRPYTHYLLVLLPSFLLFIGLFLSSFFQQKKISFSFTKFYTLQLLVVVIIVFLLSKNFNVYTKIIPYYTNYFSFIKGDKDLFSYREFFDRNTPRDYEIAQFIKTHSEPSDTIFIWGNNAQIYPMTGKLPPGRFTVLYHITAKEEYIKETYNALLQTKPRYIIITNPKNSFPYSLPFYKQSFTIHNSLIYERIF